jgi:hypothetical protein
MFRGRLFRAFVRDRYTAEAENQVQKDYQRTRNDLYRMQLDQVHRYHEINRNNMLRAYHAYLENTPGSKKALQELCDQLSPTEVKKPAIDVSI